MAEQVYDWDSALQKVTPETREILLADKAILEATGTKVTGVILNGTEVVSLQIATSSNV